MAKVYLAESGYESPGETREAAMVRRATVTVVLAMVLGLGLLVAAGAAVPWPSAWNDWKEARQVRRLADSARAGELFDLRVRMYAEGGWRPAQPMSMCDACIQAAADRRLAPAEIRLHCGTACGVE